MRRAGEAQSVAIIHASGTLAGKFNRKQTGCFKWEEARTVAQAGRRLDHGMA